MAITEVPKDWQKIFRTSKNLHNDKNFISFEAFQPPSINYLQEMYNNTPPYTFSNQRIEGYKFLHPNSEISESINHLYSDDTSTFAQGMNSGIGNFASVVGAISQGGTGSTSGVVYNKPLLWKSASRRRFEIILELFAYNDMDEDIYKPIMFFRKNSYPVRGLSGGDKENFGGKAQEFFKLNKLSVLGLITYPAVFKITGGAFETFQASISTKESKGTKRAQDIWNFYNLINMNVKFNNSTKFFKEGIPMSATVALSFEEVVNIYGDMFESATINVNVKSSDIGTGFDADSISSNAIQTDDIKKFSKDIVTDKTGAYKPKNDINELIYNVTDDVKAHERIIEIEKLTKKITSDTGQKIPGKRDILRNVKDDDAINRNNEIANINEMWGIEIPDTEVKGNNLSVKGGLIGKLQSTQAARTIKNIVPIIQGEVKSAITKIVVNSKLYKKLDTLVNTDPRHYNEVKTILKGHKRGIQDTFDATPFEKNMGKHPNELTTTNISQFFKNQDLHEGESTISTVDISPLGTKLGNHNGESIISTADISSLDKKFDTHKGQEIIPNIDITPLKKKLNKHQAEKTIPTVDVNPLDKKLDKHQDEFTLPNTDISPLKKKVGVKTPMIEHEDDIKNILKKIKNV